LRLIQSHVKFFKPQTGFKILTRSQSPVGGGLGGSSSLTISLMTAMSHLFEKKIAADEFIEIAHNIEAQVLDVPTGTQDYYPPVYGGLLGLYYSHSGCEYRKLPVTDFNSRFFVVYTGKPHHSGLNNWQIFKDLVDKNANTRQCLQNLSDVSEKVFNKISAGDWEGLAPLLLDEYKWRTKLSPVFTSPEIERLRQVSLEAGAQAVKICGAGGGGCVMVWTDPKNRDQVMKACKANQFQVLSAKFAQAGCQVEQG